MCAHTPVNMGISVNWLFANHTYHITCTRHHKYSHTNTTHIHSLTCAYRKTHIPHTQLCCAVLFVTQMFYIFIKTLFISRRFYSAAAAVACKDECGLAGACSVFNSRSCAHTHDATRVVSSANCERERGEYTCELCAKCNGVRATSYNTHSHTVMRYCHACFG